MASRTLTDWREPGTHRAGGRDTRRVEGERAFLASARLRLAEAVVTGIVDRHCQRGVISREQCLAEVTAELTKAGEDRTEVLDHSAASLMVASAHTDEQVQAGLMVLAELGADQRRAEAIAELRRNAARLRIGDAEL